MSLNPIHRIGDQKRFIAGERQNGALNHNYRQGKLPGRFNFSIGAASARIFRNNDFNLMLAHQSNILFLVKRSTRYNDCAVWQRQSLRGRVHKPQQIVMLRLRGKQIKMHPPNSKHNILLLSGQGRRRRRNIGHALPLVSRFGAPSRARQSQKGNPCLGASKHSVFAHLRRKRMRGIDHMRNLFCFEVGEQSLNASKPTNPLFNWLSFGPLNAPSVRQARPIPFRCDSLRELTGLNRASQNQKVYGHG